MFWPLFSFNTQCIMTSIESQEGAIAMAHELCTVIAPFWISTEHLWILITPFWLSTQSTDYVDRIPLLFFQDIQTNFNISAHATIFFLRLFEWTTHGIDSTTATHLHDLEELQKYLFMIHQKVHETTGRCWVNNAIIAVMSIIIIMPTHTPFRFEV